MAPITPYTADLGSLDPLTAYRATSEQIRAVVGTWPPDLFERGLAPGKWTARQILIHLAQTELALGARARMALSTRNYAAQAFDQDQWMSLETHLTAAEALRAFVATARMNQALFETLSPGQREMALTHPEYGSLTVDWMIHQMAGHQIHHLKQLAAIHEAGKAGVSPPF